MVGEDAATKRLPSVDADGPIGTIDRVELGQPTDESAVDESSRLASMIAGMCPGAAQQKMHVVPQISSNLSEARSSVIGMVERALLAIMERQRGEEETLVSSFFGLLGLSSGVLSNDGYNWRRRWRVASRYQVQKRRLKRNAPASMVRRKWTTVKWELTYDKEVVMNGLYQVLEQWLTGVTEEVLPGSDGVVRTVGVKMTTGVLCRPAAKVLFVSAMWSRHGVENVAAVSNP
jgi:Family of unknown function (DUF5641)